MVSSHAPARGHRKGGHFTIKLYPFQVMPPRGGIIEERTKEIEKTSFKSCPREGASPPRSDLRRKLGVSSHAPARGHLVEADFTKLREKVSSHAPARGHPWKLTRTKRHLYEFQVMPPRGGILSEMLMKPVPNSFKSCPREGASPLPIMAG